MHDPVFSPSEHVDLDNGDFTQTLRVTVPTTILDLDPTLIGHTDGVNGVVTSRFYHHITGSPMFLVDFAGGIGERSVRVSDTKLSAEGPFGDTQRELFQSTAGTSGDGAGPSQPPTTEESDSDPDWVGDYTDFFDDEAAVETSDCEDAPSFMEDPLQELGLYNFEEDVSSWPFQQMFADDQWQEQSFTLMQRTDNFSGPLPGPTSGIGTRPTEYFLRYWPEAILERVVEETNR